MHGFYLVIIAIISGSFFAVGGRYAVVTHDVNALVFTGFVLIFASLFLFIAAGVGSLGIQSFKNKQSYLFAFYQLFGNALSLQLALYITSTEAGVLKRTSLIASILLLFILQNKKPKLTDLISASLICVSIGLVLHDVTDHFYIIVGLMIANGVAMAMRIFTAQTHKDSVKSNTFRSQCRVTSIVMFITSTAFLLILLALSIIKGHYEYSFGLWDKIPDILDFFDYKMLILALFVGLIGQTINKYCEFAAAKKVGADNYLAIATSKPLFILLFEYIFYMFGLLSISTLSSIDIIALLIAVIAGLIKVSASVVRIYQGHSH